MKGELLRIENIRKGSFLKRIQVQIFTGEIVYCVFDNVQEKHMFLDIMAGRERPDFGRVYCEEKAVSEKEIPKMLSRYTAVISRQSILIDSVTIRENIFIVRPQVPEQFVRNQEYKRKAEALFKEFEINIDIQKPTWELSVFEKVQVEILKAYLLEKKIIIFTALGNSISDREKGMLWLLMEKLKDRGLSCIMADPLEDIDFSHTDRVVIIRHGKTCAVKEIADCDYTMLHKILYQGSIKVNDEWDPFITKVDKGEKVHLRQLTSEYLKNVSLSVTRGEIVKLFCIDERSYDEITGVLQGKRAVKSGSLDTDGKQYPIRRSARGVRDGIGILNGNPVADSLFMEMSAMDNLQMLLARKAAGMWSKPKYKKSIRMHLKNIIPEDVFHKPVKNLTGADIQKVAYCRWLLYSPELLVCIQPFADGDIESRETAREMVYLLESRKIPILIITSNTLEFNYCRGKELYMRKGEMIQKEEAHQFINSNNQ